QHRSRYPTRQPPTARSDHRRDQQLPDNAMTLTRDRTRQRAFRPDVVYVNVVEFAARAGEAFDGVEDIVARLVEIQDGQQWIGPERLLPPRVRHT
ncbi:hypothetical protein, partial [Dactylosporangium sp. NPDC000521]|uniref:hypothetical protein n=1 Tax=Dactylosporangium sp. NPDC000521 TaxID=3363975 RepID=UPI003698AAB0